MYLRFFQLQRDPFRVTPDPAFFCLFPSHREALAALLYGIDQRKGFIAVTGEVGVGKTTILRALLERIDRERIKVIYLFNPDVTFEDLLRKLLKEFGYAPKGETASAMIDRLHWLLIDHASKGRNVALIIDEAQNMPAETMEGLRLLSNLETATEKLLQIVFCGQPELEEKLTRQELRQLSQRIAVRVKVARLTRAESVQYIQHRLLTAGVSNAVVFSQGALRRIVSAAQGVPRVINILCDSALATAFGYGEGRVSLSVAREIIRDHKVTSRLKPTQWWLATAVGASTAAVLAWGVVFLGVSGNKFAPDSVQQYPALEQVGFDMQSMHTSTPEEPLLRLSATPPELAATYTEAQGVHKTRAWTKELGESAPASTSFNGVKDLKTDIKLNTAASDALVSPTILPREPTTESAQEVEDSNSGVNRSAREPVTRFVTRGDRLWDLVGEVYGARDQRLVQFVRRHNPQIKDADLIQIGDRLTFPPSIHLEQAK